MPKRKICMCAPACCPDTSAGDVCNVLPSANAFRAIKQKCKRPLRQEFRVGKSIDTHPNKMRRLNLQLKGGLSTILAVWSAFASLGRRKLYLQLSWLALPASCTEMPRLWLWQTTGFPDRILVCWPATHTSLPRTCRPSLQHWLRTSQ